MTDLTSISETSFLNISMDTKPKETLSQSHHNMDELLPPRLPKSSGSVNTLKHVNALDSGHSSVNTMKTIIALDLKQELAPHTAPPVPQGQAPDEDDPTERQNDGDGPAEEESNKKKEKKKKKKSSGKNKKSPVSGFEEFYCDLPMTPAEYEEELEIYHHSKSFVERIELCIQRYRARRKLDSFRSNVFTKYLMLGGIDTSVKAFSGGLDKDTIEQSTAAEIQTMSATDHIHTDKAHPRYYNMHDKDNWVVDFEGVCKAFFSNTVPRVIGLDSQERIEQSCNVIHNWLNYVLSHNVCPEYTQDVLAARRVCNLAKGELWAVQQVSLVLPGDFNKAASTLYGGQYESISVTDTWINNIDENLLGMKVADAERIFKTALGHVGSDKQFEAMIKCNFMPQVIQNRFCSFEVIEIIPPDEEMRYKFLGTKDQQGSIGNIKPLGVIRVKHWDNPEAKDEDCSDDEDMKADVKTALGILDPDKLPESITEEVWLEEHILKECFVGMRFDCGVRELNIGVKYFDTIRGIYTSFFTCLPNDLLRDWKEPVPNLRLAPMVGDGNNRMDMEGDLDYRLD